VSPRPSRTSLERALVGPAGEHYVLYKLHMLGMLAALAPRNAPSVDILVLNEDETIASTLQVKTRTYGRDGGWHMSLKHETLVRPSLIYVFVDLEPTIPVTYVVPSATVARIVKSAHEVWLATPGRDGRAHRAHDLRRILPAYDYPVPDAPDGWMERFKDKWDLVRS